MKDLVCVIHRDGDKNKIVGTGRSLPQSYAFGILIAISSEGQSRKYLFTVEGLDTEVSVAFLIMSFSICMQSRDKALLL